MANRSIQHEAIHAKMHHTHKVNNSLAFQPLSQHVTKHETDKTCESLG
jgi:hypothetical protein